MALNVQCAVRAAGGWGGLGRQLKRAQGHGWRDVYGTLIGLVAAGGRCRDRWYRQWLAWNETHLESNAGSRLAMIATPSDLQRLAGDCTGVVFLGARSRLHENALPALANALADGAEIVYGDADQIDPKGNRCRPLYRPDFSLDLFLHQDYLSDCIAVSRDFLDRAPPWNFDDPHGTLLRWLPSEPRIVHLPMVLSYAFERRRQPESPPAFLAVFLRERYGSGAGVESIPAAQGTPMRWQCRFGPRGNARITVVIPTRDRLDLLEPCVDSLYATNDDSRLEVLVVDNRSTERATRAWFGKALRRYDSLRVLRDDGDFNWSRLNNLGIAAGTGDVFVFLNNDTLAIGDGWLDRLAEYAVRADAGAVGPLLLFADGSVQHAGLVVGYGDHAVPIYRGTAPDFDDHAFVSPRLPRNVAAVTGACLATSRKTLETIGCFDESLALAGDVEFCLRAHAAGLVNIYAGDVVLHHYESATIGRHLHGSDGHRLAGVVQARLPRDPFYNPNLTSVAGVGRGAPAFALLHENTSEDHLAATSSKPLPPPPEGISKGPPVDARLDIVFFWKQNDTGIYGRRQDMLVKYLARHPRIARIFHFDAPIDLRQWLRHPLNLGNRGTEGSAVVRKTLRRKLRLLNRDNVRFDTFVFLASRRRVFGTLTRWLPTGKSYHDYLRHTFRQYDVGVRRTVFWACPTVFDFPRLCDRFVPDLIVADVIDDQRQWPTTPEHHARVQRNYEEVLGRADIAFGNCSTVVDSLGGMSKGMHLVPNAAEFVAEDCHRWPMPRQLRRLPQPIIGYVGNLDAARLDVPLLAAVARRRPQWQLVLIGSAHRDQSVLALSKHANVHFFGVRPYPNVLRYIRHFDVAMVPHLDNELTRHMNPLKLYVYLSLKVPIVATPIGNTDAIGEFIQVGGTEDEFIDAVERCLADGFGSRAGRIDEVMRANSWDERVQRIVALLDQTLAGKERQAGP